VRRATLIFVPLLVAALAAVAAGCGGGKSSSGGGGRLSKSEFISQADAACGDANKKVPSPPAELRSGTFDPTAEKGTDQQYKAFGDYLGKVVTIFRGEVKKLKPIKPPAELQSTWDKALSTLSKAIDEIDEASSAAKSGDRATVKDKLAESDKNGSAADKLARQLGLKVCGSSA
jgi:hypothetical protein